MKIKQNKKGFTLLELVVTIIVISVIAGLALPKFFKNIQYSYGAEALRAIGMIRESMERCAVWTSGDLTDCKLNDGGIANLDIKDPGISPNAHFTYQAIPVPPDVGYDVIAERNALDDDGSSEGDTITLTVRAGANPVKTGTGIFNSIN